MIAFPDMLVGAAREAGIEVPPDLGNYDKSKYDYWFVYCQMQLGASMPNPHCHWGNAEIVKSVPPDKIKTITPEELLNMGFEVGTPIP